LIGGWKGAAEYEKLVEQEHNANKGMLAQVVAHLVIVVFIIIGNLGYFLSGKKKKLEV
jgi:hypothetical protein